MEYVQQRLLQVLVIQVLFPTDFQILFDRDVISLHTFQPSLDGNPFARPDVAHVLQLFYLSGDRQLSVSGIPSPVSHEVSTKSLTLYFSCKALRSRFSGRWPFNWSTWLMDDIGESPAKLLISLQPVFDVANLIALARIDHQQVKASRGQKELMR